MSYSASEPLATPVIVNLPDNGLRLRFDGADQRLRLIEIVDFHKMRLTFKNEDVISGLNNTTSRSTSPLLYRRVYQLFGPSYPGEYIPPSDGGNIGVYILSFPGIALSFPLQASAWSPKVDHATMLSSSASPATSISIFEGKSWPEARKELFTRNPSLPRSSCLTSRPKDVGPDEIEHIRVFGAGRLELLRRSSPTLSIVLSQTTPQDLITELGPPSIIYKRSSDQATDDLRSTMRPSRRSSLAPRNSYKSSYKSSYETEPSSISSTNTDTFETDFDDDDMDGAEAANAEAQYYCYFEHGFDILVGPPTEVSPLPTAVQALGDGAAIVRPTSSTGSRLTATRIVLHGNIPGSYPFNRHRRSRWSLAHVTGPKQEAITSESKFSDFHSSLIQAYRDIWPEKDMKDGMVIVRSWGEDSPSGSAILIGGEMDEMEEDLDKNGEQWLGNTRLYKFPGLMFEVMHNGAVSALTVY